MIPDELVTTGVLFGIAVLGLGRSKRHDRRRKHAAEQSPCELAQEKEINRRTNERSGHRAGNG